MYCEILDERFLYKIKHPCNKVLILHLLCILFREASNTTHQSKVEVKTQHCKSSSTENKFSKSNRKFLCEKGGSSNSIIKLLIPSQNCTIKYIQNKGIFCWVLVVL